MLNLNKPVKTRDGKPVDILRKNLNSDYPIVGVVLYKNGAENVLSWTEEGIFNRRPSRPDLDLINRG